MRPPGGSRTPGLPPLPQGRCRRRALALAAVLLPLAGAPAPLASAPLPQAPAPANVLQERDQRFHPVASGGGVVAADEPRAAAAGVAMLRAGGNAVDAAVATAFALAVTLPQAGNLGGGGFLVLWLPGPSPAAARGCLARPAGPELTIGRGHAVAVNFRETAPRSAGADLFRTPEGGVDRERATRSLLSTGVPGSVAGLTLVQRCYGRLPVARVMAPAIALAQEGFPVSPSLAASIGAATQLRLDPASRRLFFRVEKGSGALRALRPGDRLRQLELATTLRRIALQGEGGFYRGPVAQALVQLMKERGGLIEAEDLRAYRARLVPPLAGSFRGHPVLTMPPPGSGLTLLQLLRLLEPLDAATHGLGGAAAGHLLVEAMNLAYRDRNEWLGDPDQVAIPMARLLDDAHIAALRRSIDPLRHRPSASLAPPPLPRREGTNTTHLSVADRQGGLVAATTTLNFPFGNGVLVPAAGFLLNNEMDDFTAAPGRANAFGLVQGAANAIAPGRRPLSSMSPTLVFRPDGSPWIATGSPGGSRIITTVLQVLLARIVHGRDLATAVSAPRLHSQLWPDRLEVEEGFSPDTERLLEAMGHRLHRAAAMGAANSVEVLPPRPGFQGAAPAGSLGVADPRRAEGPAVAEEW